MIEDRRPKTYMSRLYDAYNIFEKLKNPEYDLIDPYVRRKELFDLYVEALDEMDPKTASRRHPTIPYFDMCINSTVDGNSYGPPTSLWLDLYPKGKDCIDAVGFLFISADPKITRGADFCIQEAFVLPKYRRRGIMTSAMSSFIRLTPDSSIRLHVLKANKNAKDFWTHAFERHGFLVKARDCNDGFWDILCKPNGRQSLEDI